MRLIVSPLTGVDVSIWIVHDAFALLLVIHELTLVSPPVAKLHMTPTMLLLVVELAIVDLSVWIRELTAAVS